uniref:Uncharacterized protein n=1 Tax=Arundo donax TaxID=35708 RepID=A0A0A8YGV0_ARUDO
MVVARIWPPMLQIYKLVHTFFSWPALVQLMHLSAIVICCLRMVMLIPTSIQALHLSMIKLKAIRFIHIPVDSVFHLFY